MSKPTIADVQRRIDKTVILLNTMLTTRKLSHLERIQITSLVAELQECGRILPDLVESGQGFGAVFDTIAKLIRRLFSS